MKPTSRLTLPSLLAALALTLLGVGSAAAQPAVTAVDGRILDGQSITINGSAFGSAGPRVELFDDFSGGPAGSTIPLSSPRQGSWTVYNDANHPTYDSEGHSPPYGMRIYNNQRSSILIRDFTTPATEVFLSWWVRIPAGTSFPYYTSTPPATYAAGSNWKFTWLMDGRRGYEGNDDLCVPSYTYEKLLRLAGNDYTPDIRWDMTRWWSWDRWMRMSAWIKADPADPTAAGTFYWQALAEGQIQVANTVTNKPVFDRDGNTPPDRPQWTQVNIPGWVRENASNVRPVYDDVYIASGPNAAARVEIGNRPVYGDCTNLSLLTPTAWSAGRIAATVNQGSFTPGETVYLFVFDASGAVNPQGFPLTVGGSVTAPPVEQPPVEPPPVEEPPVEPPPSEQPSTSEPPAPPLNLHIVG